MHHAREVLATRFTGMSRNRWTRLGVLMAYLLQERRLPDAFMAEGDLRELRIASRELCSVVGERSALMRRMRSRLAQLGGLCQGRLASVVGQR